MIDDGLRLRAGVTAAHYTDGILIAREQLLSSQMCTMRVVFLTSKAEPAARFIAISRACSLVWDPHPRQSTQLLLPFSASAAPIQPKVALPHPGRRAHQTRFPAGCAGSLDGASVVPPPIALRGAQGYPRLRHPARLANYSASLGHPALQRSSCCHHLSWEALLRAACGSAGSAQPPFWLVASLQTSGGSQA
eukprot:CAMPEP_0181187402 /NCGR_PEP_ID=MMETSP1096-20121128/10552_1 /TAXON_ID=156174 ORGANISM="Chrysochromulina ericina, Strain CCMP281" /NCGR_SAMPLE_ID=MMETSP1096 /ASSEMBLY_ACC=CAM_ASM_000453 /LENGTH=191 /DNA_ID=CAMNT_0023276371 /DNA_START=20 /DNA_END=596 /DNA_ORIENTATION=+